MRTDKAKGNMHEVVSSEGAGEGDEKAGFLIKNN